MNDIILENVDGKMEINCDSKKYLECPTNYRFYLSEKDKKNNHGQFDDKKTTKLQFHVLPHPYFGNVKNPKILFLAKNPSYADYYEDDIDTYLYLKNNEGNLSNYLNNLKKANFFKMWNDEANISFVSSWKWWNKKIIRNVKLINDDDLEKIGFINLCGYQSKSFDNNHFIQFRSINKDDLSTAVNNADVIIVVWRKILEIDEIRKLKDNNKNNNGPKWIVLNNGMTGANVNSLYRILNGKSGLKVEDSDIDAKSILGKYFKK